MPIELKPHIREKARAIRDELAREVEKLKQQTKSAE